MFLYQVMWVASFDLETVTGVQRKLMFDVLAVATTFCLVVLLGRTLRSSNLPSKVWGYRARDTVKNASRRIVKGGLGTSAMTGFGIVAVNGLDPPY